METRLSPLHDLIAPLNPRWAMVHGMRTPMQMEGDERSIPIRLSDATCLPRMGVKGAQAETWLLGQGIEVPLGINNWLHTPEGTLVARLARSEFFLEDGAGTSAVSRLSAALAPASGITPVLRQDGALVLYGERVNDLLTQTCSLNFRTWKVEDRTVVMTSMAGVSVLVIWEPYQGLRRYRVWCDHTFAPYLWVTLVEIARELGGAVAGLNSLMPEVSG